MDMTLQQWMDSFPKTDPSECDHDEHDHNICLECGADITDEIIAAAEYRQNFYEDR